ncbi:MAG: ribosome maturation factor RimM [Treponema sp.]|nr:ribosome maturation factor RimM [Treponema sp.]
MIRDRFTAGIIGAPFGLEGFVKVKPLSGEIDHLLKLKSAALRQDGKERVLTIEESAPKAPIVVMRFAGFHSPQEAKALAGAELLVSREEAAALKPGEFYVEDLKGLAVFSGEAGTDGEAAENPQILGHINAIIEGGGGDLAEIALTNGKLKLVPFRKEFFSGIDLENRRVTLNKLWILE